MDTETLRGDGHVKAEAEIGMIQLQLKEYQGLPAVNHQKLERGKEGFFPKGFRGSREPYRYFDFGLLVSRTVGENKFPLF